MGKSDSVKRRVLGKRPVRRIMLLLILIIVLAAAAIVAQSLWNIGKGQYEERVSYGNTLTLQMGTNVSTLIHQDWDFAHYARNRVEREQFQSEEELLEYLRNIEQDSDRQFLFIRKDGHLLKSDGVDAIWQAQNLLITGKEEFYISDTTMFGSDGSSTMYFILPLNTNLTAGDSVYTHLLMAQKLNALDPFFKQDESVGTSLTFILRSNGTQIYQRERRSEVSKVYNVLARLKNAEYSYGESYDTLEEKLKTGVDDTVLVNLDGVKYYLSEYHLDISDWILMILVPEETIQTGSSVLADVISRNIIYIYSSVALVVIVIVGGVILKTLEQQREIAAKLRQAAEAERQASIAKTNFLSAMSHDIRTPMNAIVNYTNLAIKKQEDREFVSDSLQKIKLSSDHLLTLVNDVLDISRIESGKMILAPVSFNAEKLFRDICEIVEPRCRENQVRLCQEIHLPLRHLCGDTLRLKQIYLNIITNAIKYNVSGGEVHVTVTEEPDEKEQKVRLRFVCRDTGIGISPEFQQIMYQEFVRETDSRVNHISGTGLGLSICKQLVKAMNGSISCESVENEGTTFTVLLELPLAEADSTEGNAQALKTEEEWRELLSGLRILIAEDNKINWNMLNILLQDVGIQGDWVRNGKECVDTLLAAEENAYDAVLMDIRMPVMDGREAAKRIRSSGKMWLAEVPIIALSADAFSEDKIESLEAGMDEHITKPVDADILYQSLYALVKVRRREGS